MSTLGAEMFGLSDFWLETNFWEYYLIFIYCNQS